MCTKSSATGNQNENCSDHVLHESYWQIKLRNTAVAEAVKTINSLNCQPTLLPKTHIHLIKTIWESLKENVNRGDYDS